MTEQEDKIKFYNDTITINQIRRPYSLLAEIKSVMAQEFAEKWDDALVKILCNNNVFNERTRS